MSVNEGPRSTQVVLVRHGESTWNELSLVQGQDDQARLTRDGRAQAMSALANLVDGSFDSIESSDLTRATETASIFAAALGLAVTTTSKLRERSFGEFEGRPIAELPSTLSGIRNGWVVDATARPEGGESLDELLRRVADVVETWRHSPSRRLLVVTHGGTIRAIRAYCSGLEMQGLAWDTVGNCSLWTLDVH